MRLNDITDFRGQHVAVDETGKVYCMVFALCDRPATTTVPNPVLGAVPSCQRCADRLA